MIQKYVDRFLANEQDIRSKLASEHPNRYEDIVQLVIGTIGSPDEYGSPDPERIHVIDDGDYQGTLLFVIGANGYQPDDYWYVFVSYGSCSGCDTLEAIRGYSGDDPTPEQVNDYWTLALHVVQRLSKMD